MGLPPVSNTVRLPDGSREERAMFDKLRESLECLNRYTVGELVHQTKAAMEHTLFESQEEKEARIDVAEDFIEEQDPLYRHYCIPEVQSHVEQFTGETVSRGEAIRIVQRCRDKHDMGPIQDSALRRW